MLESVWDEWENEQIKKEDAEADTEYSEIIRGWDDPNWNQIANELVGFEDALHRAQSDIENLQITQGDKE